MEGIVAKRTLKKSYYNNKNVLNSGSYGLNQTKVKSKDSRNIITTYKQKWMFKIILQTITMISIIAFVLSVKILKLDVVLEADITKNLVKYCNTNYSYNEIINSAKQLSKSAYIYIKPIVPKEIESKVVEVYNLIVESVDKRLINNDTDGKKEDEIKENEVIVYEESSVTNKESEKGEIKENIGVSLEEGNEEKIVAVSSSLSSELSIVDKIKDTNIQFVKPVSGSITSHFGAREVIFEGIDSYHTGTDIAAKTGTKVVSSIDGKVTRATYNKYNGNFVEVTNGKVATIYCHLSKISVKVGSTVKKGEKIGEVGSTGLSTGPHLHFEIVFDGEKVDPTLIVNL